MNDPIADMLARIRNAISAKQARVDIPASKLKLEICRILKEEGHINNFVLKGDGAKRSIRVFLRTDARGTSSITHLERVSRPNRNRFTHGFVKRKANAPDLLFPKSASKIGKQRIEAVVEMNLLKLKASLQDKAKSGLTIGEA